MFNRKKWYKLYYIENKEKLSQQHKEYNLKHKKQIKEHHKKYDVEYRLKNRKKRNKQNKQWRRKYPWLSHYYHAKQRCENFKSNVYKYYGGKGIKILMIKEEFKQLWFRDKAYNMKQPSIDRINNDGNYELQNCRFIEVKKNRCVEDRMQFRNNQGRFCKN